jgi:hypothetical protein
VSLTVVFRETALRNLARMRSEDKDLLVHQGLTAADSRPARSAPKSTRLALLCSTRKPSWNSCNSEISAEAGSCSGLQVSANRCVRILNVTL